MSRQDREYNLIESVLTVLKFLRNSHIPLDRFMGRSGGTELLSLPGSPNIQVARSMIRFMDEMPGGFLIYRADGDEEILYANRAILRIFRCNTLAEFLEHTGSSFRGMVFPEDLAAVEKSIWDQIAASHYDLDYVEYRIRRKDGAVRWIEDYGHFVRSEAVGNIFYVFLGDATEKRDRLEAERETWRSAKRENEEKFQGLIDAYNQEYLRRLEVIEGLSVYYESILYGDLEADRIFPYRLSSRTREQFDQKFQFRSFSGYIADYVAAWVHPEDSEAVAQATAPDYIREKLAQSATYYINYRALERGTLLYLQLRLVNVSRGDQVNQVVLGYRRVDEEIRREMEQSQALAEALNKANQAISAKNTFLSNMSHDMRTPLNAIFGFTALAGKKTEDPAAVRDYLGKIEAASRQLLGLIDEVLETSWRGSGEACLMEEPCDLPAIVREVHSFLLPQAQEKNIAFTLDCGAIRHRTVLSDSEKLRQLALSLANNAITYTEPGGKVTVTIVETEELPSHRAVYRLTVADTGIGIGSDFLEAIFEPFSRERNTTLSGIHGIGLGLSIAKSIAEALGGTIEVKSEVGQGSTFTATFRLRIHTPPVQETCPAACRHILLAEDNEINQEIAAEILRDLNFTVDTADNGAVALEKVARSAPGDYDLVLMDIQMPVMDGWEAARAIRRLENPALAQIPIIALSANVFESDIRTSIESGMDAHLPKPIDIPLLLRTIGEITQRRQRGGPRPEREEN